MSTAVVAIGLACLVLGGTLGWLISQLRGKSAQTLAGQLAERDKSLERSQSEVEQLRQELQQSQIQQARLEEKARTDGEKLTWLDEAEKQIRTLTDQVLSEQREVLAQKGRQTFSDTLKPFSEQIKDFRAQMDSLNQNTTTERTELRTLVESLSERTGQMGEDARELTQALKGDSQMRGEWGEVTLERVLEMSGLQKGVEYEVQQSFSHDVETGTERAKPDVIVRLPDERDIVIDSKLTLNSWIAASQAKDEVTRAEQTKLFLRAVATQIDNLAGKRYQDIEAIRTLDLTFLFIPVEPAYICVQQQGSELVSKALQKRVAIVSPNTLLPLLHIVESIWRVERQSRNSQKIAEQAGKMHAKLVRFLESMEKVGKGLDTAQKSYDEAHKHLRDGRGNLIRRAEELEQLGVRTTKSLPDSFTDAHESDD